MCARRFLDHVSRTSCICGQKPQWHCAKTAFVCLQIIFIDTFHLFEETHELLHQLEVRLDCQAAAFCRSNRNCASLAQHRKSNKGLDACHWWP